MYDRAFLDRLTAANTQTLTFFSSVSKGTLGETFKEREVIYMKIIQKLEALKVQARARPIPIRNTILVRHVNASLKKRGVPTVKQEDYPSATALINLIESIKEMRDIDSKEGLTTTEVEEFKNETAIYMNQALTYESAYGRQDSLSPLPSLTRKY